MVAILCLQVVKHPLKKISLEIEAAKLHSW